MTLIKKWLKEILIKAKKIIIRANSNYFFKLKQKKLLATPYLSITLFSAYQGLTSLFGMGRGVPPELSSPIKDFVL